MPGNYNFGPDSNNGVNNTGNGYANGLLGYVASYSQQTARAVFNVKYWNAEFYVQDNCRVSRRLTLDYGMRFYHQTPQVDTNNTFANFVPSTVLQVADARASTSPAPAPESASPSTRPTNTVAPVAYIGLFVPNSRQCRPTATSCWATKGRPSSRTTRSRSLSAPRFGFAYDVTGDGKTAIRGGFGDLLQPPGRQPGVQHVGPGALRLHAAGELHHVRPDRCQRQQPGVRSARHHQHLGRRRQRALGPRSQREPGRPAQHRRQHGGRRRLHGQLGLQPEPHAPTSTRSRSAPGLRSTPRTRTRPTATGRCPTSSCARYTPGFNTINNHNCSSATPTTTH